MVPSRPLAAITGASSGIGAEFARQLAARGFDLCLVARRREKLEQLRAQLSGRFGIRVEAISADLANASDVNLLCSRLAAADNLEMLVNNAGFGTVGYFFEADPEHQEQMHRVHVLAPMKLTRTVLPALMRRGRGGVINVASVAGFMVSPGNISYCATKAWMNRFTEGLYLELRSVGSQVRVQALCPGFTYSEFHDAMGVNRRAIPRALWMSAELVVARSLEGFDQGQLFVVPGWQYRVYVRMLELLPSSLLRAVALRYGRHYRNYYLQSTK